MKRVFLIVLDSVGVGAAPDAARFGDAGSNTLGTCRKTGKLKVPNLEKLGLFSLDGMEPQKEERAAEGCFARMTEKSNGKDTTTGHWEIAGLISEKPMPVYPHGFPDGIIKAFEEQTHRGTLCNLPYSGTEVIKAYGQEHIRTGKLIVYTSADSVFQIAAHEEVVPLKELYEDCRIARKLLSGEHAVGRVIARPFVGSYPDFTRTVNRHDFSLLPPQETVLDEIQKAGMETIGVGKIYDIFAGKGISRTFANEGNDKNMERVFELQKEDFTGLCFVNLVDFDALWGHRRNVKGYAEELERFDVKLGELLKVLREDDLLIITADHGNDPTYKGTDHTREQVMFVAYSPSMKGSGKLEDQDTFAVIGATIADNFGVQMPEGTIGTSLLAELK